jgi:hypothetical protein
MKIALIITGLALITALLLFLTNCKGQSSKSSASKNEKEQVNQLDNPYNDLRKMALERTAQDLALSEIGKDEIYGVIMDWDLGTGIMTLVTYKTGDASMYLSSGGGVIGGGQHEKVNKAAIQFVTMAKEYSREAEKAIATPLPDRDCVRFYFLTITGIYFKQEQMANFENESSSLLKYFEEANKVITELRLTTENR